MRDNTTKVLEEAYKQVIKENRISQMQPEEIMSLDPATLNNLTLTVGELVRLSGEQLQALRTVAGNYQADTAQAGQLYKQQQAGAMGDYDPSGIM